MSVERILPIIDAIYAAATDHRLWPNAALTVQKAIGGHSVNLVLENKTEHTLPFVYSNGVSLADTRYYETHIAHRDTFTEQLEQIPPGTVLLTQNYWRGEKLLNIYSYRHFYHQLGYEIFNAGLFYKDENKRGWLSVVRSAADPLFSHHELALMQNLLPHLKRAFMINSKLARARQCSDALLSSLEHVSAATILLSRHGALLKCNSRAHKYLCCSHTDKQGYRVRLPNIRDTNKLNKMIRFVLNNTMEDAMMTFYENGVRKAVLCFPWRTTEQQMDQLKHPVGCIIFILSPLNDALPAQQLTYTFNLTKAELPVLQRLMQGDSVKQLAEHLFISEATVRFHIRSLLRKSECRNQVQLVSKAYGLISTIIH
ncbi:helix-turn-helix transcriptional regulator [Pseudoalteromonas sp. BDTF-M6]|uniref:response regulator transcription factor n=1 Tax=Pseudoalteromonas sp. BDTF-M6 TaxID=2796132 RepID=UPI001BAF43CB|nr:helix-turn-helix transcriptional regulator [Pseudoalteromonas sp. BDTF-M6]MBS3796346.1 helix-turn-helix transcriptional regulator [Pseudoalteromonas sp. BDTF-M6]